MKKNKNDKLIYVVGYCRYSSDGQREESIVAQKRAIQQYADEHGMVIIAWYIDRAISGTSADRKEFQRMIEDSAKRKFELVLIHKLDRFSRDIYDAAHYEYALKKNGVGLFSVIERLDDSPESTMMKSVLLGMAAYYSQNLGRETLKGMIENAYKAMCNGSIPPYGYKRIPKLDEHGLPVTNKKGLPLHETVLHPEQAEAVKLIFTMTLEGKQRHEIISRLEELGYKNGKGETFKETNLDNIMRNERYTGIYIFHYGTKKRDYDPDRDVIRNEGGLPEIISKETFEAVQVILGERKRRPPAVAIDEYLLSGKIFCGECGDVYRGQRKKRMKGGYYYFYRCQAPRGSKDGAEKESKCCNCAIDSEPVEWAVITAIQAVFNTKKVPNMIEAFNRYRYERNNNEDIIKRLEQGLKSIEEKVDSAVDSLILERTEAIRDKIRTRLESYEREKEDVQKRIQQEHQTAGEIKLNPSEVNKALDRLKTLLKFGKIEHKKEIIRLCLNKVVVFQDRIEIYVNILPKPLLISQKTEVEPKTLQKLSETAESGNEKGSGFIPDPLPQAENGLLAKTFGSPSWTRTNDPAVNSRMLYRLSY